MNAYQKVAPTLALILSALALCLGGAVASGKLVVTSGEIKNGTINTKDLAKNSVRSADIRNGTVSSRDVEPEAIESADIENGGVATEDVEEGAVKPVDVTFPAGGQVVEAAAGKLVPGSATEPTLVTNAGGYAKKSAESELQVTWTGTAQAIFHQCIFQLRVDGHPASSGAGETYVQNGSITGISITAVWTGLPVGGHSIEVWAHSIGGGGECVVGPEQAEVAQTYTVQELVK